MGEYQVAPEALDGTGARIAIVVGRFNQEITSRLLDGARRVLATHGLAEPTVVWVPGAYELPLVCQWLARSGGFDAIVALGAVIRGDTPHFDYVAGQTAAGLLRVGLDTDVPVVFGVLTTDTPEQARARIGGPAGHKGEEAACTALEMVGLARCLGRTSD